MWHRESNLNLLSLVLCLIVLISDYHLFMWFPFIFNLFPSASHHPLWPLLLEQPPDCPPHCPPIICSMLHTVDWVESVSWRPERQLLHSSPLHLEPSLPWPPGLQWAGTWAPTLHYTIHPPTQCSTELFSKQPWYSQSQGLCTKWSHLLTAFFSCLVPSYLAGLSINTALEICCV